MCLYFVYLYLCVCSCVLAARARSGHVSNENVFVFFLQNFSFLCKWSPLRGWYLYNVHGLPASFQNSVLKFHFKVNHNIDIFQRDKKRSESLVAITARRRSKRNCIFVIRSSTFSLTDWIMSERIPQKLHLTQPSSYLSVNFLISDWS